MPLHPQWRDRLCARDLHPDDAPARIDNPERVLPVLAPDGKMIREMIGTLTVADASTGVAVATAVQRTKKGGGEYALRHRAASVTVFDGTGMRRFQQRI